MKNYEKPMVIKVEDVAESVYMASGSKAGSSAPKCDSKYMNGNWQGQGTWSNEVTYKDWYGCIGCPANTANGCGLNSHYADSNYSETYDVDAGKRKPAWEWNGYKPNDILTDWGSQTQNGSDKS